MAAAIRFTDELRMQLIADYGDYQMFSLQLPLFVWLAHGGHGTVTLDDAVNPIFYINSSPGLTDQPMTHLLRGACEAACEEAWTIYQDLLGNGLPEHLVRQILPVNLMTQGTVVFSEDELKGFVNLNRDSSTTELALVAQGYERALTDG